MTRKIVMAIGASLVLAGSAIAAEPIEGTWKRPNGTVIKYSSSGGGKFCGTVMTGEYKGKSIGCMKGAGNEYRGEVHKLDEGKTYVGTAKVNGRTLALAGCVRFLFEFCKSENLSRQ